MGCSPDGMRLAPSLLVSAMVLVACGTEDPGDASCSLDAAADAGTVSALKAERCNVPGSMGARKWYRLSATLPGTDDVVQLELYDQAGAFAGGIVRTGTFTIEADPATCGVCVRALGNKGSAEALEYRASTGTVTIDALGADGEPISATITDATFEDVEGAACTTTVARVQIDGTVDDKGGNGTGGGGGGGGGGMGCLTTIGD